jgi:hypothetical protein
MNESITGTAVPTQAGAFDIQMYGRAGRLIEKRLDSAQRARQREDERKLREARRVAKHDVEMLAIECARSMMERDLYAAIELEKTNPELAAKLRGRIMDRAVGKVPSQDEDAAAKRKGGTASDLVEFLQAVSGASNRLAGIGHQPGAAVSGERDVTPIEHDPDAHWLDTYQAQPNTEEDDHE